MGHGALCPDLATSGSAEGLGACSQFKEAYLLHSSQWIGVSCRFQCSRVLIGCVESETKR